jgi:hypothetical protein
MPPPLLVDVGHDGSRDIRTLAAVIEGGVLGELWLVESRMDQENRAVDLSSAH